MEDVRCEQCGGSWRSPVEVMPDASAEVAAIIRSGDVITAIRRLRELTGMGLGDAKAVYLHVTRLAGRCHRCDAALSGRGLVVCEACRSLNYDL